MCCCVKITRCTVALSVVSATASAYIINIILLFLLFKKSNDAAGSAEKKRKLLCWQLIWWKNGSVKGDRIKRDWSNSFVLFFFFAVQYDTVLQVDNSQIHGSDFGRCELIKCNMSIIAVIVIGIAAPIRSPRYTLSFAMIC